MTIDYQNVPKAVSAKPRPDVETGGVAKLRSVSEEFFPHGGKYEYVLQRLRLVSSTRTDLVKVASVKDVPEQEDPDGFPNIEVVLRIRGLKLKNPATGQPLMSEAKFKEHFEGRATQQAFLKFLAGYIASSIPQDSTEAHLKPKFKTLREGRAGTLPPRADLLFIYQKLLKQMRAVKTWLKELAQSNGRFARTHTESLLKSAPESFRWLDYIRTGDLTFEQVHENTALSTTLLILSWQYGIGEDMLRHRLFR